MAERDRSQGFGFMYVNITKLLEERKDLSTDPKIPVTTTNVHHANFTKPADLPQAHPASSKPLPPEGRTQAIKQIRENLDRLQSLHHKLHAMLDELNKIPTPNKKSRN